MMHGQRNIKLHLNVCRNSPINLRLAFSCNVGIFVSVCLSVPRGENKNFIYLRTILQNGSNRKTLNECSNWYYNVNICRKKWIIYSIVTFLINEDNITLIEEICVQCSKSLVCLQNNLSLHNQEHKASVTSPKRHLWTIITIIYSSSYYLKNFRVSNIYIQRNHNSFPWRIITWKI